jgi:hypothetical protein
MYYTELNAVYFIHVYVVSINKLQRSSKSYREQDMSRAHETKKKKNIFRLE